MKAHIRHIFFENEKIGEFIRNEANHENWPIANTYGERVCKDWKKEIDNQQAEIDQIINSN